MELRLEDLSGSVEEIIVEKDYPVQESFLPKLAEFVSSLIEDHNQRRASAFGSFYFEDAYCDPQIRAQWGEIVLRIHLRQNFQRFQERSLRAIRPEDIRSATFYCANSPGADTKGLLH